jgi:transposase
MQDLQRYAEILGIHKPWFVDRVELKLSNGEVHVHLEHLEVEQRLCPECGEACRQYDHQPERRWRHLHTCQYETILHAKPLRAECGQHAVRLVKLP